MKIFLKALFKFATPKPNLSNIVPGTSVIWDGRKWEAREQQTLGWVWQIVQGRGIGHDHQQTLKFFYWDHPIYEKERFSPLPGQKKVRLNIKKDNRDKVVNISEEYQSPEGAYQYALKNGPFPEGEHFIAKSSRYSYLYASKILRKRFLKGEKALMEDEDPYYATMYAVTVLKHRWHEIEGKVAKHKMSRDIYMNQFAISYDEINQRFYP